MAGLYFHIPFCRQACTYCNFHFSTLMQHRAAMVPAMIRELEQRASEFPFPLETLYFGGGTPSVIPAGDIAELIRTAALHFNTKNVIEITLEANPEDITPPNLEVWKAAGVNRLSIGIQSLDEEELKQMNRCHSAKQAVSSVELALRSGIESVNVDLIFGSPWLSDAQWQRNLDWAFACGADHISAYALTVEPKTALAKMVKDQKVPAPHDEKQALHYHILTEMADRQAWDFYEISNLSKPGRRAVHNSNYWQNKPYLGIGPGAHSYINGKRSWNVSNNALYIKGMEAGAPVSESETLTEKDRYNEFIMTRLRLAEGVQPEDLAAFSVADAATVVRQLDEMAGRGYVKRHSGAYILTTDGRLLCDYLTAELML